MSGEFVSEQFEESDELGGDEFRLGDVGCEREILAEATDERVGCERVGVRGWDVARGVSV